MALRSKVCRNVCSSIPCSRHGSGGLRLLCSWFFVLDLITAIPVASKFNNSMAVVGRVRECATGTEATVTKAAQRRLPKFVKLQLWLWVRLCSGYVVRLSLSVNPLVRFFLSANVVVVTAWVVLGAATTVAGD